MDERSRLYDDGHSKDAIVRNQRRVLDRFSVMDAYCIAEGWSRDHIEAKKELLERIHERMCEGYVPMGGVSVTTIRKRAAIGDIEVILYSQAMVKHGT